MNENQLAEYFEKGFDKELFSGKSFKLGDKENFLNKINNIFGTNISKEMFKTVVDGQGKEKRKIKTVFSSSLQSLLIFSGVSKSNPIHINGIKYTNVLFEYKNRVIGYRYPSSMDVVLYNEDGDILFIESKLTEFIQSSCTIESEGIYVVGKGYFVDKTNSYYARLKLNDSQLKEIGIEKDRIKLKVSKRKDGSITHRELSAIVPLQNHTYVYAEGIKQILSHVIGIHNFESGKLCKDSPKFIEKEKDKSIRFLEITNELPGITDKDDLLKIKEYHEHIDALKKLKCLKKYGFNNITYQDVYLWNKNYFDKLPTVVKFYHLK